MTEEEVIDRFLLEESADNDGVLPLLRAAGSRTEWPDRDLAHIAMLSRFDLKEVLFFVGHATPAQWRRLYYASSN